MSRYRSFPAKLLLFGEYVVLAGSRALAIPTHNWHGALTVDNVRSTGLDEIAAHIERHAIFDVQAIRDLREDIARGLTFHSDIPQGYGVGSSGALCAAMWARYHTYREEDLLPIRETLARMESLFHGQSSGMDPLVSLLDAPVLRDGQSYRTVKLPEESQPVVFLVDSGQPHDTAALVDIFKEWMDDDEFRRRCLWPLVQHTDHAIAFFLEGHWSAFFEHLHCISALQYAFFKRMIPPTVLELWEGSLEDRDVCIKLCGAGGGGYFMGIARPGTRIPSGDVVHVAL